MANEQLRIQNLDHSMQVAYNLYLELGIDAVTKEMIARGTGLCVKSIHRYFTDKTDCVLQVAEWLLLRIQKETNDRYPNSVFTSGQYTGVQLLERYMTDVKNLFLKDPRVFILYTEFKMHIYRHCTDYERGYALVVDQMGNRELRQRIYELGKKDGSMPADLDVATEEEYFNESYFGFLANLAISNKLHPAEEVEKQIDLRIKNTVKLYTCGKAAQKVS